jgi:hypothetical protein
MNNIPAKDPCGACELRRGLAAMEQARDEINKPLRGARGYSPAVSGLLTGGKEAGKDATRTTGFGANPEQQECSVDYKPVTAAQCRRHLRGNTNFN